MSLEQRLLHETRQIDLTSPSGIKLRFGQPFQIGPIRFQRPIGLSVERHDDFNSRESAREGGDSVPIRRIQKNRAPNFVADNALIFATRRVRVGRPSQAVAMSPRPTTAWEGRPTFRHSAKV